MLSIPCRAIQQLYKSVELARDLMTLNFPSGILIFSKLALLYFLRSCCTFHLHHLEIWRMTKRAARKATIAPSASGWPVTG